MAHRRDSFVFLVLAGSTSSCLANGDDMLSLVQQSLRRILLEPTVPPANPPQASCNYLERALIKQQLRAFALGRSLEEAICHTATEGEECYRHVKWAMTDGYKSHPELYNIRGLHYDSTFEDFQQYLYSVGHKSCDRPCWANMTVRNEEFEADVVFANLPSMCKVNLTNAWGINFDQLAECVQNFLKLSPQCTSCGTALLKDFAGADIFNLGCLPACQPMTIACKMTQPARVPTGDCLEKASACLECARPAVLKFHQCVGSPQSEQVELLAASHSEGLQNASEVNTTEVNLRHLNTVVQLVQPPS